MNMIRIIMNMTRNLGSIRAVYSPIRSFTKYFVKWSSIGAVLDGCYTYGTYKGSIQEAETTSIVLSKMHSFWFYIFEFQYDKFIYSMVNNIAYYLQLPMNVVYWMCILIMLYLVYKIMSLLLGIMNIRILNKLKKEKIKDRVLLSVIGNDKKEHEYNQESYDRLIKLVTELKKENEELKKKK